MHTLESFGWSEEVERGTRSSLLEAWWSLSHLGGELASNGSPLRFARREGRAFAVDMNTVKIASTD